MINQNMCNDGCATRCTDNKPLELYLFIDPLCHDCWSLDPVIKKLQFEYGHYFSLIYVLSGKLTRLNKTPKIPNFKDMATFHLSKTIRKHCVDCSDIQPNVSLNSPYLASIAIKAAELQGRKSGVRFLRKIQEYLYLKNQDITNLNILLSCAKEADLDVEEFKKDIHSTSTAHAFQCDLKITNEMNVSEIPTVVFFNNKVEEEGLKLSGVHAYEVYVEVITEILGEKPIPQQLPNLLDFIKHFQFVTTKEISIIYGRPLLQVETELKKLMLQQEVLLIETPRGSYWKYVGRNG